MCNNCVVSLEVLLEDMSIKESYLLSALYDKFIKKI